MVDSKKEDAWIGIYWKPAAAVIYLLICLFDFVIVPTYLGIGSNSLSELIILVKDLPLEAQQIILTLKLATWDPLTLKGGGLFHAAFGAILGATVWSRGQERINEIKNGWGSDINSGHNGYDSSYSSGADYSMHNRSSINNQPTNRTYDNPDEQN